MTAWAATQSDDSRFVPSGILWNGVSCIMVTLDNHWQVAAAYGPAVATAVESEIDRRARLLCGPSGDVVSLGADRLLLIFDREPVRLRGTRQQEHEALLEERVLVDLGRLMVSCGKHTVLPVLSVSTASFMESSGAGASGCACAVPGTGPSGGWRSRYVTDMKMAVDTARELEGRRVWLECQPISGDESAGHVMYQECLLRLVKDGRIKNTGSLVLAMERLGLVRGLDRWVMLAVLDLLRADSDARLGCNISALSARLDGWWTSLVRTLRAEPTITRRLVIEITETAALPDLVAVQAFVSTLRSLGCQIALDDFGTGHSNMEVLVALQPDIVKIGMSYVHRARNDAQARACLAHLAGMAISYGACVVAEGIETEDDIHIANLTGATWLQGNYFNVAGLHQGGSGDVASDCMPGQPAGNLEDRSRNMRPETVSSGERA